MNVLFMSLGVFDDLSQSSVHIDIIKRLAEEHDVWLVCKHEGKETDLSFEYGIHVLRVHTGTLKKVGLIKKGVNTLMVESQFTKAIKKHLSDVCFDLVLYTTPPITFANAVKYVKTRDNAVTYLLLKDIFPQNAVDLGMIKKSGPMGIVYRYFRNKEKTLYNISDYIGCMSPANVSYTLENNPEIDPKKVEVCPNATIIEDMSIDSVTREEIRRKYGVPIDKKVFVYGGNLGKPQGIPFLLDCIKSISNPEIFFLIVGKGTEYSRIDDYIKKEKPVHCKLMAQLPKNDFETLVAACDVGMIFLDYRFKIPNFPSRLLSYMKAKIPVLAATDPNTDIGQIIVEGDFGWSCSSNDVNAFSKLVSDAAKSDTKKLGDNGFEYMKVNYSVDKAYEIIMNRCRKAQG